MIRFTPDDPNLVASMSPLRIGDPSADYGVASERAQVGSLCRHRARRLGGDPSTWLDDPAGPYATYYCSCRREPRLAATKTTADSDEGPVTEAAPPDVAVAPIYGTSAGVSRPCGHPRQHVVVCTTAGAEKIYQDRYASSCKYSTFLGGEDAQSRSTRGAVSIAVDGSGSHAIDPADGDVTSSAAADVACTTPVNV